MSVNTQTIRIDLNTGRTIPVAFSHQGDTARSFVFEVYNNGETFSLTGYTAKIAAMLPADNGYRVIAGENMADGTISENTITATLPADFTAKPGRGVLTIVLTGSGTTIRPINIDLRIQKSADAAETIAGASDFVPILEQYMAEGMATYINAWLDEHPEAMQYYIAGAKLVLDDDGILSIETDTDEIVAELDLGTLRSEVDDLKSDLQSLEGGGLSNEAKTVLLRCFQNVAWINDQGQTYYDSLYAALYPPVDVLSISAVFTQGSAVIYDTDSLDTLKQYLVVTATMTDSTTETLEDTDYTLSGTLTEGTSVITVSYGGKTTTFNVTVTSLWDYKWDYTQGKLEDQDGWLLDSGSIGTSTLREDSERIAVPSGYRQILIRSGGSLAALRTMTNGLGIIEVSFSAYLDATSGTSEGLRITAAQSSTNRIAVIESQNKFKILSNSNPTNCQVIGDFQNGTDYTVRIVFKGSKADVYVNGELMQGDISTTITVSGGSNNFMVANLGSGTYVDLKSLKLKIGSIS